MRPARMNLPRKMETANWSAKIPRRMRVGFI
jgi:hypothetical protein